MAIDAKTLAASKKYTNETVIGGGAIKGKNCTIDSISPITGGNRVRFKWTLDDGTPQTGTMDVLDGAQGAQGPAGPTGPQGIQGPAGADGLGINSVDIDTNNHLIITYDDGTTHDAGEIPGGGGTGEVTSVNGKKGVVKLYGTDIPVSDAVGAETIALSIDHLKASDLALRTAIHDLDLLVASKVDKEAGKGLSSNDFTTIDKTKLTNLEPIYLIGSGLNLDTNTGKLSATGMSIPIDTQLDSTSSNPVQNQAIAIPVQALQGSMVGKADKSEVNQIKLNVQQLQGSMANKADKSDLGTAASKNVPASGDASNSEVVLGSDSRLTDARNAADVYAWAKAANKPIYTASEVGAVATTDVGSANGVAGLGSDGKVPAAQLPSYVDDVEEYASQAAFPVTGESGKIYVDLSTNKTYRWSGTTYVVIGGDLALGETSTTAYAGNKGKANADAIAAIKDGTNIDSFADVETALGGKENTISDLATIRSGAAAGATAYQKPSTGVPKTDLAADVQTSLGKADTAYQKTSTGVPKTDLAADVQTSLGKADTALQQHQSLANYYQTGDTAETALADNDYFPFQDVSASAKRKTLWGNIKSVLKAYFDTLYSTIKTSVAKAQNGTTLSLVTTGEKWNYDYQNIKRKRYVVSGATHIGTTGIGTWDDSATPNESDWLQINDLKNIENADDVDVALKFDPISGEPVTLGGYIIDTTTGKICIKFGNEIATPANATIAIDISWNRNEVSEIN